MPTIEEWRFRAVRGTSGDMVHDILKDWEKDKRMYVGACERLSNKLIALGYYSEKDVLDFISKAEQK